jgi:PAS domain S-box-containing protein
VNRRKLNKDRYMSGGQTMNIFRRIALHRRRYPLSHRLIFYVVLCSVVLTLLTTAIPLYLDFKNDLADVHRNIKFIEDTYLPSIISKTYYVELDDVEQLLQDALRLQGIKYLEVYEYSDAVKHTVGVAGNPETARPIHKEYPLIFQSSTGKTIHCGFLKITAGSEEVYRRLWKKALLVLVANALKIFLVSLFILVIIQALFVRHLATIANYAKGFKLDNLTVKLSLDRKNSSEHPHDELDQIVSSMNDMRLRMIQDIAQRKRAEEKLAESEEKYRRLVETMNGGLGIQDENGLISYVNDSVCNMLGYGREALIGRPVSFFLDSDNAKILQEQVYNRKNGKESSYELEWLGKDGKRIPTIMSDAPLYDTDGSFKGSVAVMTDITLRKKAEEALRESEEKFRLISEQSMMGITVLQDDRLKYANQAVSDILGYSIEEMLRWGPSEYLKMVAPEDVSFVTQQAWRTQAC